MPGINCHVKLKKGIIKDEVFKRELCLCAKLSREHKGRCSWGVCGKCGVIPLLYKLHDGILLEDKKAISSARKKILKNI